MSLTPGGARPSGAEGSGSTGRVIASDGVALTIRHDRALDTPDTAEPGLVFVLAHGFTGHTQQPKVRRIADYLRQWGGVLSLDFRGHGTSAGWCTVGDAEVLDVAAVVRHAKDLGYQRVVTIGFSMGASVVVRQACLDQDGPAAVDAVVAVSGPAFWFYRGTPVMRVVHRLVQTPAGRLALRARGVRVWGGGWPTPHPMQPVEAAAGLRETPFLLVHGTLDRYFPLDHPRALQRAAQQAGHPTCELWIVPGMGHAEAAIGPDTVAAIASWAQAQLQLPEQAEVNTSFARSSS